MSSPKMTRMFGFLVSWARVDEPEDSGTRGGAGGATLAGVSGVRSTQFAAAKPSSEPAAMIARSWKEVFLTIRLPFSESCQIAGARRPRHGRALVAGGRGSRYRL